MFNREQKRTVAALLAGDSELCGRAYTHDEIARWMLTASKLSKNRIGDYLGRDDANSASILAVRDDPPPRFPCTHRACRPSASAFDL